MLVRRVFDGEGVGEWFNRTLIVMVPKKENPQSFSDFRPISLRTVIYKIVTKVIANRLKVIMPMIVSLNQSSFAPSRHITNNILNAQKGMHSMEIKKGKKKWMALKIDLEKAYDRVSWDFIEDTLEDASVPYRLARVIMSCILSSSMQISWNGVLSEQFKPTRGVR